MNQLQTEELLLLDGVQAEVSSMVQKKPLIAGKQNQR